MQKCLLPILSLLLLSGCASQKPVTPIVPPPINGNPDFTISATWNYDFTNFAACSSSVTKGCIASFTLAYQSVTGTSRTTIGTSPVSSCTGTKQPTSCSATFNSQLPVAPSGLSWIIITNFIDINGTSGSTSGASGNTTNVAAVEATSVSVGIQ